MGFLSLLFFGGEGVWIYPVPLRFSYNVPANFIMVVVQNARYTPYCKFTGQLAYVFFIFLGKKTLFH